MIFIVLCSLLYKIICSAPTSQFSNNVIVTIIMLLAPRMGRTLAGTRCPEKKSYLFILLNFSVVVLNQVILLFYIVLPPINDNGHYVKFECGLLICYNARITHSTAMFATIEVPYVYKNASYKIFLTRVNGNTDVILYVDTNGTTTSTTFRLAWSGSYMYGVNWLTIGYWK